MWIRLFVAAVVVCLVLVEPRAVAGSHLTHLPGRKLLQAGGSSAFCPDGCADGFCQQAGTEGGLRCTKCNNNLLVDKATGQCACAAGQYSAKRDVCRDCPKGSFCPGSVYSYAAPPQAQPCPSNMTTVGLRSTSIRSCVNMPGFSYTLDAAGVPSATRCPADSYSPGYKKQRACVPCPTGFSTSGRIGATTPTACVLPAGYYLKAPGVAAPCPKGEWKSSTNASAHCTSCARAVTTLQEASTSEADCIVLLPGFYAVGFAASGAINATAVCPQAYVCPGGTPRQAGLAASQADDASGTITPCPDDTMTQEQGATDLRQCLTPPGHFTADGVTSACPNGSFRADWKPAAQAASCTPCGEGVQGLKSDRLTLYLDNGTILEVPVMSSADDCYIQAGQGLYYNTLTHTWRAKDCDDNNYGVSNTTFGLSPNPCKPCPSDMVASTSKAYNASAQYFVRNTDGSGGFASELACVTKPGYGLSGRVAQPCAAGAYNAGNNREVCRVCGFGYTTSAPGVGITAADCRTALGYGVTKGVMGPCPVGSYNDKLAVNASSACKPCSVGLTTPKSGSDSVSDCSLCSPGYGGTGCSSLCGGVGENATYGPAGRAIGAACVPCSAAGKTATYSFEWNQANDWFTARTVSRSGSPSATECLSEYSQMSDGSFYLPLSSDVGVTVTPGVASFAECVKLCDQADCQLVTYDYQLKECSVRVSVAPVYEGSPYIAFKALPAGYTAASSVQDNDDTTAKGASTGIYTVYQEEQALAVGIQEPAPGRENFISAQDCMEACDEAGDSCVGVTILDTVKQVKLGTSCSFIRANLRPGVFKRSMVRTSLPRLTLPSAFLCPSGYEAGMGMSSCVPIETPQEVVLLLTANGTCSPELIQNVTSSFQTFFSSPFSAWGVFTPTLAVTVDCFEMPTGQTARRLLASEKKTILLTTQVTFKGTEQGVASLTASVQEAGGCNSIQGLQGLEGCKVDRIVPKEEIKQPTLSLESQPRTGPLEPYTVVAAYLEDNRAVPMSVSLTTEPADALNCTNEKLEKTQVFTCYPTRRAASVVVTFTAPNFQSPVKRVVTSLTLFNLTCVKGTAGADECSPCEKGYFAPGNTDLCEKCPDGQSTVARFSYELAQCGAVDIDGCVGNPCLALSHNNGTCMDVPAPGIGFTCGCEDKYAWNASTTTCYALPTNCSAVPTASLVNGSWPGECAGKLIGQSCTASCSFGGSASVTCLASGSWELSTTGACAGVQELNGKACGPDGGQRPTFRCSSYTIETIAGGGQTRVNDYTVAVPALSAKLVSVGALHVDKDTGDLYMTSPGEMTVLRLVAATGLIEMLGGVFNEGAPPGGDYSVYNAMPGTHPAHTTFIYVPTGVAYRNGSVFVAEEGNHIIRKIDLASQMLLEVAGVPRQRETGDTTQGLPATQFDIGVPNADMQFDQNGNLFVIGGGGASVEEVYRLDAATQTMTTIAVSGPGKKCPVSAPAECIILPSQLGRFSINKCGEFAFSDRSKSIRKYRAASLFDSALSITQTVSKLMWDLNGYDVWVGDGTRLLRLQDGELVRIAGNDTVSSSTGDGGPADLATMRTTAAMTQDAYGNVYVADALPPSSVTIRKLTCTGVTAVAPI